MAALCGTEARIGPDAGQKTWIRQSRALNCEAVQYYIVSHDLDRTASVIDYRFARRNTCASIYPRLRSLKNERLRNLYLLVICAGAHLDRVTTRCCRYGKADRVETWACAGTATCA